jgi:hypothetical protein
MSIRRERKRFYVIAQLVQRTTWVESTLEELGGVGGGVWEKLDSIAHKFPEHLEKEIIAVAEVRNSAVHKDPNIENEKELFSKCDAIEQILKERIALESLTKQIEQEVETIETHGSDILALDDATREWLTEVARQEERCTLCGSPAFQSLFKKSKKYLSSLKRHLLFLKIKHFFLTQGWAYLLLIAAVVAWYLFFWSEK